jgi:hypothetical protein
MVHERKVSIFPPSESSPEALQHHPPLHRSAEPLSVSRGPVNISSEIFVKMADAPNDAPATAPFQAVQVEALVS